MKKNLIALFITFCLTTSFLFAQNLENIDFPYTTSNTKSDDVLSMITGNVLQENGILFQLLGVFGFDATEPWPIALIYVRTIINLLLWLTSFVALIIVIYTFYLMFFSDDAKWMETVKKNLKWVAIALVILGFSRVIVSFIFNFYKTQI